MVEVSLHPPEHILRMRQQYEISPNFWGRGFRDPKSFFIDLARVKNSDYEPARETATEAQLSDNPRIELSLVRRGA